MGWDAKGGLRREAWNVGREAERSKEGLRRKGAEAALDIASLNTAARRNYGGCGPPMLGRGAVTSG